MGATAATATGYFDQIVPIAVTTKSVPFVTDERPLARLVAYAHAGVEPRWMGTGPAPATRDALARATLRVADLDVIEVHELARTGGRHALVAMCIGGGQGIAAILERV